ncbi:hypothetical protein ACLMNJ_19745 [Streptomyces seoulensis]
MSLIPWHCVQDDPEAVAASVRELDDLLNGPAPEAGFQELNEHVEELRTLLELLRSRSATTAYAHVCLAVWHFWLYNGHIAEAARWFAEVTRDGSAGEALPDTTTTRLRHAAGMLAYHLGDLSGARELLERGLRSAAGSPAAVRADLHLGVARIAMADGDLAGMRGHGERALAVIDAADDDGRCTALHILAEAALLDGRLTDAETLGRQALELAVRMRKVRAQAAELCNLANVRRRLGDHAAAAEMATRALHLLCADGNRKLLAYPVLRLGQVAADRSAVEQAALLLGLADELVARTGAPIDASEAAERDELAATVGQAFDAARAAELRTAGATWADRLPLLPDGTGPAVPAGAETRR